MALDPVGLSRDAQRVYRELLRDPRAEVECLAERAGLSRAKVLVALDELERHGLVGRVSGAGPRLLPAPDLAIGALIRRERDRLDAVRGAADYLTAEHRRADPGRGPADPVELLDGRAAVALRVEQLQRCARREILQLDRPPYATAPLERPHTELERLAAGVRYRTVYDQAALDTPGQLERLARVTAAGEAARTLAHLPVALVVADGESALLSFGHGEDAGEAALAVSAPVLVNALSTLFELRWEQAIPIAGAAVGRAQRVPDPQDLRILSLMAAGLKDEAIAFRLDISARTLRRRVAALMRALGAHNRFAAGYHVARRGWLEQPGKWPEGDAEA